MDEIYSDFEFRDSAAPGSNIVLFSYGEYVPSCEGIVYGAFLDRAEHRARVHGNIRMGGAQSGPLRVVKREWFCATSPDIAVVHVYFEM
jgi:hypothetical protein